MSMTNLAAGNRNTLVASTNLQPSAAPAFRGELLALLKTGTVDAIADRLRREGITHLDLSGASFTTRAEVANLARALRRTDVSHLSLEGCRLPDHFDVEIADLLEEGSRLVELNLSNNDLGWHTAAALGNALAVNGTLKKLDLSTNALSGSAYRDLMTPLCREEGTQHANNALRSLNLSGNTMLFADWFSHLRHSSGSPDSEYLLTTGLGSAHCLESLDLSNTGLMTSLQAHVESLASSGEPLAMAQAAQVLTRFVGLVATHRVTVTPSLAQAIRGLVDAVGDRFLSPAALAQALSLAPGFKLDAGSSTIKVFASLEELLNEIPRMSSGVTHVDCTGFTLSGAQARDLMNALRYAPGVRRVSIELPGDYHQFVHTLFDICGGGENLQIDVNGQRLSARAIEVHYMLLVCEQVIPPAEHMLESVSKVPMRSAHADLGVKYEQVMTALGLDEAQADMFREAERSAVRGFERLFCIAGAPFTVNAQGLVACTRSLNGAQIGELCWSIAFNDKTPLPHVAAAILLASARRVVEEKGPRDRLDAYGFLRQFGMLLDSNPRLVGSPDLVLAAESMLNELPAEFLRDGVRELLARTLAPIPPAITAAAAGADSSSTLMLGLGIPREAVEAFFAPRRGTKNPDLFAELFCARPALLHAGTDGSIFCASTLTHQNCLDVMTLCGELAFVRNRKVATLCAKVYAAVIQAMDNSPIDVVRKLVPGMLDAFCLAMRRATEHAGVGGVSLSREIAAALWDVVKRHPQGHFGSHELLRMLRVRSADPTLGAADATSTGTIGTAQSMARVMTYSAVMAAFGMDPGQADLFLRTHAKLAYGLVQMFCISNAPFEVRANGDVTGTDAARTSDPLLFCANLAQESGQFPALSGIHTRILLAYANVLVASTRQEHLAEAGFTMAQLAQLWIPGQGLEVTAEFASTTTTLVEALGGNYLMPERCAQLLDKLLVALNASNLAAAVKAPLLDGAIQTFYGILVTYPQLTVSTRTFNNVLTIGGRHRGNVAGADLWNLLWRRLKDDPRVVGGKEFPPPPAAFVGLSTGMRDVFVTPTFRDEIASLLKSGPEDAIVQLLNRDKASSLDLSGAQLGQDEIDRLGKVLSKTNVTRLSLQGCSLTDECDVEIGQLVRANPQLVELDLSDNRLGLNSAKCIGEALEHGGALRTLDLSRNRMNGYAFVCIMCALCTNNGSEPSNKTLQSLNFSGNADGKMFAYWFEHSRTKGGLHSHHREALSDLGPVRYLTSLDLSNTGLSPDDPLVSQMTDVGSCLTKDQLFGTSTATVSAGGVKASARSAAIPSSGPYGAAMKSLGVSASTATAFQQAEPELALLVEKYFCGDGAWFSIDSKGAVSCRRRLPTAEIMNACKAFASSAKPPSIRVAGAMLTAQAGSIFELRNFALVREVLTQLGTMLNANPTQAMSLVSWNEVLGLLQALEVRVPHFAPELAPVKEVIRRAKPPVTATKGKTGAASATAGQTPRRVASQLPTAQVPPDAVNLTTTVTSTTTAAAAVTMPAAPTGLHRQSNMSSPETDTPLELRERIQAETLLRPSGGIPPGTT
ncbi:MAG: hypothetical protein V4787_24920 [Pseudomonadota bacterium]